MTERERVEGLIDQVVMLENFRGPHSPDRKIELLCFALEELKYERRTNRGEGSFEEYVQSEIRVRGNQLLISAPAKLRDVGSGTNPIQLQASLLLFLLLNHKESYQVLEIIQHFIKQVRDQLTFLDFKKTKTEVTRCFTNTRFAANAHRDYGLLKLTHRKAFKTWELSLAGFLVAANVLKRRSQDRNAWHLSALTKDGNFDLLPEIRLACQGIQTFDAFQKLLALIVNPTPMYLRPFSLP